MQFCLSTDGFVLLFVFMHRKQEKLSEQRHLLTGSPPFVKEKLQVQELQSQEVSKLHMSICDSIHEVTGIYAVFTSHGKGCKHQLPV